MTGWVAVGIVGRELVVTALRTVVEQEGGDFSAKSVGKWKMVLQCLAAGWSIVHLTYVDRVTATWSTPPPAWMSQGLVVVVWAAVITRKRYVDALSLPGREWIMPSG